MLPSKSEQLTSSGADKPKTGDVYLLVTLTIENTSPTATIKFDPASLVLMDVSGGLDISMVSLKSLANELQVQDLKPGQQVTGVVAYEVPQKDNSLELMFNSSSYPDMYWTLGS